MAALHRSETFGATGVESIAGLSVVRSQPRPARRAVIRAGMVLLDAAILALALAFATWVRPFAASDEAMAVIAPLTTPLYLSLVLIAIWVPFLYAAGLYAYVGESWGSGEFSHVVQAISLGSTTFVLLHFIAGMELPPRIWVGTTWIAALAFVLGERLVLRFVVSRMHLKGRLQKRTLVIGTNSEAAHVVSALTKRSRHGFAPVGCLASSLKDRLSLDYTAPVLPTLGNARDLIRVIDDKQIDTVIVVSSAFDHEVLERIIAELAEADVEVFMSSSLADVLLSRLSVREVAGMPLIAVRGISLSPSNIRVKRAFDLATAGLVLLAGFPVWLLIALAVKLSGPGPVLYRQERVGQGGKRFGMFKFRSMVDNAEDLLDEVRAATGATAGPLFKCEADPRVTSIGRWLRRYSIDEFPQVLNVLRGEMSLVGPRPPLPHETLYYDESQWRRLEVVPGLTGLWQVSGRSNLSFDEMVSLDLFYIGNWSLALDLSIIARTLPAVLTGNGAY
jgi:exopolysaccharide biosynthesis polyprenyl glycosylphosphotransferase